MPCRFAVELVPPWNLSCVAGNGFGRNCAVSGQHVLPGRATAELFQWRRHSGTAARAARPRPEHSTVVRSPVFPPSHSRVLVPPSASKSATRHIHCAGDELPTRFWQIPLSLPSVLSIRIQTGLLLDAISKGLTTTWATPHSNCLLANRRLHFGGGRMTN